MTCAVVLLHTWVRVTPRANAAELPFTRIITHLPGGNVSAHSHVEFWRGGHGVREDVVEVHAHAGYDREGGGGVELRVSGVQLRLPRECRSGGDVRPSVDVVP